MRNSRIVHGLGAKHIQFPTHSIFNTNLRHHIVTIHPATQKATYSSAPERTHKQRRLHGRTAMITGGSSGIGYAIAERFLQEGASKVILVGRRLEKLQDASKKLSESMSMSTSATLCQPNQNQNSTGDGEIATRAPEEDDASNKFMEKQRIGFLVGDVSVANEWMGELEKEMVLPSLHEIFLFFLRISYMN